MPPTELREANLSSAPHFETSTTLRVGDLNYGNHMGNDTILALAHEFRVRLLAKYDCNELDLFGKGIIMSDSAIQYRAQGFWGQEIYGELWFIPTGTTRFDLYYRLKSKMDNGEFFDVALVKTGQVFFDYKSQKVSTPEGEGLKAYQEFLRDHGVEALL